MSKTQKPFIPWSKILTVAVLLLVYGFVIWACYEMHRLNDLSPIGYMAASIIGLLATTIATYFWRAKHKDLVEQDMVFTRFMAELNKEFPGARPYKTQQPGDGSYSPFGSWGGSDSGEGGGGGPYG